jgi:hypothetical protein
MARMLVTLARQHSPSTRGSEGTQHVALGGGATCIWSSCKVTSRISLVASYPPWPRIAVKRSVCAGEVAAA